MLFSKINKTKNARKMLKNCEGMVTSPYDKITQEKVKALIEKGGEELIESFYKELDFGTGGMRGIMGVGPNRINKYTIGKATQGLANTLITVCMKVKTFLLRLLMTAETTLINLH